MVFKSALRTDLLQMDFVSMAKNSFQRSLAILWNFTCSSLCTQTEASLSNLDANVV